MTTIRLRLASLAVSRFPLLALIAVTGGTTLSLGIIHGSALLLAIGAALSAISPFWAVAVSLILRRRARL